MVAAIWGVFIWKEFKGARKVVYGLLAAMFCFFVAGLGLIIMSGKSVDDTNVAKEYEAKLLILETDLGNDVDDAIAMDLLYKYQDEGRIRFLMIGLNKEGTAPAEYADIMNTWYGYPDIPVGVIRDGADCESDAVNYAKSVVSMTDADNQPVFARSHTDIESYPDAHILYRKILSAQPDNSVTIASVGFSTNLVRLLQTPSDEYSPLCGNELVAKKVRQLVVMAGNFEDDSFHEYNVVKDIPSAKMIFEQWPTPVVASPFEVGIKVLYPATSIENDFLWAKPSHPVVQAYKAYLPMPYDRPSWDPTAVLYAVEGGEMFTVSPKGDIRVTDEGSTVFTPNCKGSRQYLSLSEGQADSLAAYLVERMRMVPVSQSSL